MRARPRGFISCSCSGSSFVWQSAALGKNMQHEQQSFMDKAKWIRFGGEDDSPSSKQRSSKEFYDRAHNSGSRHSRSARIVEAKARKAILVAKARAPGAAGMITE